jgi:penicillin-binding protein 2
MLIFDQLKRSDPQLRLLTLAVLSGVCVLLAGLWWVQIVSARDYQENLETQSFRTVRIPAMRGKILDRNGLVLAENRPVYNVSLYLEELRDDFQDTYKELRPKKVMTNHPAFWKRWLGAKTVQTNYVRLSQQEADQLTWQAREEVASDIVQRVSRELQQPLKFDAADFRQHYEKRRALPYPIATKIDLPEIARFEEHSTALPSVDLEIQSARVYPNGTIAAHLLGHLQKDPRSIEGEEAYFDYRLPDYRGVIGIEGAFDKELHGHAGEKTVLVNNLGYRQAENIWTPAEPGHNVVLTIDLPLQRAVEQALPELGPTTPGAAVVMDVNTGDVLAMASCPTIDPSLYIRGFAPGEYARVTELDAEKNRATQENYMPGSIFKPIVAMACLDNGMDPNAIYQVQPNPEDPAHGCIYLGRRKIRDTARPGNYDFKRALIHSSNAYFIFNGLRTGVDKIVELGERFHLGERIGLNTRQETPGTFPDESKIHSGWTDGDTANLCIGQGWIDVTPLQMTVVAAAIANGGKVLWPRLVDRIESQDSLSGEPPEIFPKARVRDTIGVKPSTLRILQEAMLDDTENPEGTAYQAFHGSPVNTQLRVCGKTGTAQVQDVSGRLKRHDVWFLSFAPYGNPRYAVVVFVEGGSSGGGTCAPIARKIYEAILEREKSSAHNGSVAQK